MMCACWRAGPAQRPDFTRLRNQIEQMMERNSTSDYLSFSVDESRDYYRMKDRTTASSQDSDEVFNEGFTDSGRGSSPHLEVVSANDASSSSNGETTISMPDTSNDRRQMKKKNKKGKRDAEPEPIFLIDSPQSSDQHLLPAKSSDSSLNEAGWIGGTSL